MSITHGRPYGQNTLIFVTTCPSALLYCSEQPLESGRTRHSSDCVSERGTPAYCQPTMCFHAILSFGNVLLLCVSHHPAEGAVTGVWMEAYSGVWMDGSICPLCSTCPVATQFCSISTAYGLKLIAYSNAILYIIANILLYYHPSNAVLTNITKWYILLHLSCTRL